MALLAGVDGESVSVVMVCYSGPTDEPVPQERWAGLDDDVAPALNDGDGDGDGVYTDQVIFPGASCPS